MGVRRTTSVRYIGLLLLAVGWLAVGFDDATDCYWDSERKKMVCDAGGTIPGDPATGKKVGVKPPAPPPLRYLQVVGGCWQWSRFAPGMDTWAPGFNEDDMWAIIFSTPRCVSSPGEPVPDRAWRIFRSFPLASPGPTFNPSPAGITGYPTYLAATNPTQIDHNEVLENGTTLEVRALVTVLNVDWGDGWSLATGPEQAVPYPDGAMVHIYKTKTCTPEYRETHVSGRNCHAFLEAYPVTSTFTWAGEYRNGGPWISIGTLDLNTTVHYDVDEVFGVLISPDR